LTEAVARIIVLAVQGDKSSQDKDIIGDGETEVHMLGIDAKILKPLAHKYIWWKTPDEAIAAPERVIAQVMNIGDYADVQWLAEQVGDAVLREVLTHAQAGQFNARSWAYWHYRLGLAEVDCVPALPVRSLA
jgi:hypothetical protein